MNRQHLIESHHWRKTPLALAILAALPGVAVPETFAAGVVPGGPPPNPVGPEFQVNIETIGYQITSSIAMDAKGDFVIVWRSAGEGNQWSHYNNIQAQLYNASGETQGPEFRVNTDNSDDKFDPNVAMDPAGDFVVTWSSNGQDGDRYGVYAQRYDAAGVPRGLEFQVNNYTLSDQSHSAVAMDTAGNFVIVWQNWTQGAWGYDIYAQRYNAAGIPQGPQLQANINPQAYHNDQNPKVAMNAAGDFVIVWQSWAKDRGENLDDGDGIYARRYDAAGVPQGPEIWVNTYTPSNQRFPAVAMDAHGDFVIAWQSYGQDGYKQSIYAQRYDAARVPQGTEFRVNTETAGGQGYPAVAMDPSGDFVITWQSFGQDGDSWGIYGQRYDATGKPQGPEFQVNTYTTNMQVFPAVAMDAAGDFLISWQSYGQDGDREGIFAQGYAVNNYNAAFNPPVLSGKSYNPTPVPEGPAGVFSFTAHFCDDHNSAYPLSGLASRTITLTNNNCLLNRDYGPTGTPSGAVSPCGVDSVLDFPATGGYSDYALAVGECVDVTYQIGLQEKKGFSFFVDVGGM